MIGDSAWRRRLAVVVVLCCTALYAACAMRRARLPLTANESWRSLEHEGREREFLLHRPAGAPPADGYPLLFVVHGGGGEAEGMRTLTRGEFERLAAARPTLIVYPQGVDKSWNDGRRDVRATAHRENIDDVGFFRKMVAMLAMEFPINSRRVYSTGISNGGFMSLRLICQAAEFRGAFAVAAQLSHDLAPMCNPRRAVDVALIVGEEDPLVPFAGGAVRVFGTERGQIFSARESFDYFMKLNGCSGVSAEAALSDNDPEDETRSYVQRGQGCQQNALVEFLRIAGGGHTWPGGVAYLPEAIIGRTARDFSAAEHIWRLMEN